MHWTLVIIILANFSGGADMETIVFHKKAQCEKAAIELKTKLNNRRLEAFTYCVQTLGGKVK